MTTNAMFLGNIEISILSVEAKLSTNVIAQFPLGLTTHVTIENITPDRAVLSKPGNRLHLFTLRPYFMYGG